jgi:hypothetical protein
VLFGLLGAAPVLVNGEGPAWWGIPETIERLPGKINLDSRVRYEVFDQSGGLDVDGTSHRIRYGYTTPEAGGLQAMIEGETVYAWGHGADIHPADNAGDGTDLNQLWVAYRREDLGMLKLGRQIYTLDDHRFIGHVGWRQNIQTFDAVTGTLDLADGLSVKAFYIDAVNTVTAAHNNIESYGVNASYTLTDAATATLFYYSIDGRTDIPGSSSDTAGVRIAGSLKSGELAVSYAVSYARQWENAGFRGADFGHDYFSVDTSIMVGGVTLGCGLEILDGNGIHGFSTPLATLHKFNGFADVFLGASGSGGLINGLEDYQAYAGYTFKAGNGIKARLIHHWFQPRTGGGDYGNELDLVASYQINERFSVLGKYGHYTSDGGSGGVGASDKTMFAMELNFVY